MTRLVTIALDDAPVVTAPDGSVVHVLGRVAGGSMATFSLAPGAVAQAVAHRTVEELWYVLAGRGRIWRKLPDQEDGEDGEQTTPLVPGLCVGLPAGARFQFRCDGAEVLRIVAVTMPPWPGADEAYPVPGPWAPSV